jgi:hypothetical protein
MADPQSFADLVVATARQKLAAAKARQSPNLTAEKPREAIFDALHMVGEAIAQQGFSFTPSGPKFSRRSGDFTFAIHIQSDRNNVAGQRAAILVHVGVYSRSLTAWSKKHLSDWVRPKSSFPEAVLGNQLGYLCDPSGWVKWDFADGAKRRSVADDLIASLRQGAFPLFAAFEGSPEDIAAIAPQSLGRPEGILSYFLSVEQASLAIQVLQAYLDERPEVRRDFKWHYSQFLENGIPAYGAANYGKGLAAFAVATGLTLNVS